MTKNYNNLITIIVPAYNEAKVLQGTLDDLKTITNQIIVIDDASNDQTGQIAQRAGVKVYCHLINLGLGGALATGLTVARNNKAKIAITFDADGQHQAKDIPVLIQPILEGRADVVIGSRWLEKQKAPWRRKFYNFLGNLVTLLLDGIKISDSQSGLRAFNQKALSKIDLKSRQWEVSSEFFREIKKHHLRLVEVPIKAIYTDYSLSKGQNFIKGVKTLLRLVLDKLI